MEAKHFDALRILNVSCLPPAAAYVEGREEVDRGASQQPMTQVKCYASIYLLKKERLHVVFLLVTCVT